MCHVIATAWLITNDWIMYLYLGKCACQREYLNSLAALCSVRSEHNTATLASYKMVRFLWQADGTLTLSSPHSCALTLCDIVTCK